MEQDALALEEKGRRCKVMVWAYAYEIANYSLVSDAMFDSVCKQIDVSKSTGYEELDSWFIDNFQPFTGMWIHELPEKFKRRIRKIVEGIIRDETLNGDYL